MRVCLFQFGKVIRPELHTVAQECRLMPVESRRKYLRISVFYVTVTIDVYCREEAGGNGVGDLETRKFVVRDGAHKVWIDHRPIDCDAHFVAVVLQMSQVTA